MKRVRIFRVVFLVTLTGFITASCHNESEREKAEERAEAQVGKIYNPEVRGIEQENRANQFYISRGEDMKDEAMAATAAVNTQNADSTASVKKDVSMDASKG